MLFTGGPKKGSSSQWGSPLSCFITDTDKTNLLHECWDMIINVLINECATFKDIIELCSGWFMGPDYSRLSSEAPRCSFHQMGRLRASSFHLTLVLFAAGHHRVDLQHSLVEMNNCPHGGRFPAMGNIHPVRLWVWSFSLWVAPC